MDLELEDCVIVTEVASDYSQAIMIMGFITL